MGFLLPNVLCPALTASARVGIRTQRRNAGRCCTVWLIAVLVSLMLGGCASGMDGIGYYWQSISGHLSLMRAGKPIDDVLATGDLPPATQKKLSYAVKAREFASRELGLPDNGSYRRYADIGRSHVVWNVFATEELSLRLKRWCFPIAGCIGYRGYYSEQTARQYGDQLADQGMDVQVAGVPAYSTLGWFDDPIPSTIIRFREAYIARLIFHELAHQVVYVKNDSTFNESFATAVELEGMRRWFAARRDQGHDAAEQARYEAAASRKRDFVALLRTTREKLAKIYSGPGGDEEKRAGKVAVFEKLKSEYTEMKAGPWQGYAGYDRWFARPLGNAHLAAVGAYHDLVPAFSQLIREKDHQMDAFYEAVRELGKLPPKIRDGRLKELADRSLEG